MEQHPERITEGVVRSDGRTTPFNAGDAMAAVVEMYALPIPSSFKARLGKAAKELLEDGFSPAVVVSAMLSALRLARPHLVQSLAVEIQAASHGQLGNFLEYRTWLQRLNKESNPELRSIYDTLKEGFK